MTWHDIPIRNAATANYSILSANLPGKFYEKLQYMQKYTFGNKPFAALNNQNITINEHGE